MLLTSRYRLNQRLFHKKFDWPKNWLLVKNPQFWSNFDETLSLGPINEIVNWAKFGQDWIKIMDFLLIAYFEAGQIFYETVPMCPFIQCYFCSLIFRKIFIVQKNIHPQVESTMLLRCGLSFPVIKGCKTSSLNSNLTAACPTTGTNDRHVVMMVPVNEQRN